MNFTDKTFNELAQFERYYKTACDANWCSNPGRAALAIMHAALDEHDKRTTSISYNCGSCQLTLVKRVGYLYYADKAERASAASSALSAAIVPPKARVRKGAKKTPQTKE